MKKIISFILTLTLLLSVVSCLGVIVNAEETDGTNTGSTEITDTTQGSENGGDTEEKKSCTDNGLEHKPVDDIGYAATCETDGLTDGSHCEVCGEILVPQEVIPKGHTYTEWRVVTEATLYAPGEKYRECSVCEYTETQVIPQIIPGVPHITSLTNASTGLTMKWNAVEGATSYNIYKRKAGQTEMVYLTTVTDTTFLDTAVASGYYYRYAVSAVSDAGESAIDSGIYTKRLANPYSIAAANKVNGINVTWGRINGATAYRVYRMAAGEKSWKYIGTATVTNFLDKNVKSNTYYKYTVRATCGSTYSWFNSGYLTKRLLTPTINDARFTNNSVTVSWTKIDGALKYNVYRRAAGQSWKCLGTVSSTTFTDKTLAKNTYYRYTIRAVCGKYISDFDAEGLFFKFTGALYKPSSKADAVSYYNKAINNAKSSAKEVVLVKAGIQNINCDVNSGYSSLDTELEKEMKESGGVTTYNEVINRSYLPPSDIRCNISSGKVKSYTCKEEGLYYVVTLVIVDQTNPSVGNGGVGSAIDVTTKAQMEEAYADSDVSVKAFSASYKGTTVVAKVNKVTGKLVYLKTSSNSVVSVTLDMGTKLDMKISGKEIAEYKVK